MAKAKNKKSKLADNFAKKRKQQMKKKTPTPFEVHVNRDKRNVLGRKSKADHGLPGIARTKAITKRKNTLLQEFKVKDKDNVFLDRRIGEKNLGMTEEDKTMARFAAERVKAHKKKNIFNLNDEEVLTHRGQSLMDIEKYDDPRSDDEFSDDDKTGKLDKNFVEDAHFGGGVLSRPTSEMSRKDLINQLIANSKKRKAERQKLREETIDLTERLDSEWRDLLPIVTSNKKNKFEEVMKADDYDITVKKMKFEARGMATDKLKSDEVIAEEERLKIEKLEADRLARMVDSSDQTDFKKNKHRSADDLDDFHIEVIEDQPSDSEDSGKKGILINNSTEDLNFKEVENNNDENENEEIESTGSSDISHEENGDDKYEDEGSNDDSLSDLKASDSSDNEEEPGNKNIKNQTNLGPVEKNLQNKVDSLIEGEKKACEIDILQVRDNVQCNGETDSNTNVRSKGEILSKARNELPDTFEVPTTFEELQSLFKGRSPDYQSVIVERIIESNPWKKSDLNKEKLLNLFSFILKYLNDFASSKSLDELVKFFEIFDRLCPYLYDLTHVNSSVTKSYIQDVLKEKHNQFENNIKAYPGIDTLFLFKLVSILYPTSDFRHPIVTPCLVFMSQILFRCKVRKKSDISKGLFLCTLILEYTLLSKRWSPSAINFLRGVIYLSIPKPLTKLIKVIPPFKSIGEFSNILVLEENQKQSELDVAEIKMQIKDFVEGEIYDDFRIRTFVTAIKLLCEFQKQCSEMDAIYSIFDPILTLLKCGSVKKYPRSVRQKVEDFVSELENLKLKKLEYLAYEKKRPKALRLYEPRIEVVYDGKRHKPMSKAKAEREKLLHKIKKETKSAVREVRRDNAFLSKVKIKQQIANDAERKRKVKEIFGDAAMQQNELKKFKKKK